MEAGPSRRPGAPFRVGEWTVRWDLCRIERGAEQRHLRPMLVELLALLAEQPGEVVSKSRILDRLRESRIVGESTLSRDVAELRRALGDDVRRPRYIATVSKRGYRLVAPVLTRALAATEALDALMHAVATEQIRAQWPCRSCDWRVNCACEW